MPKIPKFNEFSDALADLNSSNSVSEHISGGRDPRLHNATNRVAAAIIANIITTSGRLLNDPSEAGFTIRDLIKTSEINSDNSVTFQIQIMLPVYLFGDDDPGTIGRVYSVTISDLG